MATVSAGWALLGKRPRSNDDYSVIAASSWPFPPEVFEKIILQYLPGDPPAGRREAPDGLPRVTFGTALRGAKEPFLGVVIQDWSNDVDGANRQIVHTRFFCFQFDELVSMSISFGCLYHAVRGLQLPQDQRNPLAGDPLPVELAPADPAQLAGLIEHVGLPRAAAAAAGVLDRPMAVLAGDVWPVLDDRLEVLDAVAALLPAGAKVWLHTGAWADSWRKRRPLLAFTERAREEDGRFQLRGEVDEPHSTAARDYQKELERLGATRGVVAVVRHLATLGSVQERDQVGVSSCLASLDQARNTLRQARGGNLRPSDVRQLIEADRLGDLTEPEQVELFHRFIEVAEPPDLTLLDQHWRDQLYPTLLRTAQRRLWYDGGSLDSIRTFVDVATRVGQCRLLPELLRGLENAALVPSSRSLQVAAALVEQENQLDDQVYRAIASVPALTAALVMRRTAADPDAAVQWLRDIDRMRDGQGVRMADAVQPIRVVLGGVGGSVDWQAVDVLNLSAPGAVLELVKICRQRWPERLSGLMTGVLPWLQRSVGDVVSGNALPPGTRLDWVTQLQHFDPQATHQQAAVDLLFYCLGQPPKHPLERAVVDQYTTVRNDYIDTFAEQFRTLPQEIRDRVLDGVLKHLKPGWSRLSSACTEAVLRFLWLVGRSDSQVLSEPLLRVVVTELGGRGAKYSHQVFEPWRAQLIHHPHLMAPMLMSQLRQMPRNASVFEVADLCARALADKRDPCEQDVYDVLDALRRSPYRTAPSDVEELLCAIAITMDRLRVPDVLVHTRQFTEAILHPLLEYDPVQLHHEVARAAVFGIQARVTILETLETRSDPGIPGWLEGKLKKVIPLLRDMSERLGDIAPSPSSWSITKGLKSMIPLRRTAGSTQSADGAQPPGPPQQSSAPHGQR